jgi:uncharacterized damage-inducible protein DinB
MVSLPSVMVESAVDTAPVAEAAAALLDQTAAVVVTLTPAQFTARCPAAHGSSVGGHVRHILDHFAAIFAALDGSAGGEAPAIDYDHRARGTAVESSPAAALGAIDDLRSRVAGVGAGEAARGVRVRVMLTAGGEEGEFGSTLGRELAFATHHAVHHHAIVKIIAASLGAEVPEDLGKAPSTARHEADAETRGRGDAERKAGSPVRRSVAL